VDSETMEGSQFVEGIKAEPQTTLYVAGMAKMVQSIQEIFLSTFGLQRKNTVGKKQAWIAH